MSESPVFVDHNQISVALTTYNGQYHIKEQLYSILNQTLTPYEIVICDDNSTDDTVIIIENIAKSYNQIKLFVNKQNLGINFNFQKAISLCNGEYIALSDQDDIWAPEKLMIQLASILEFEDINGRALLSAHDFSVISSEGKLQLNSIYKHRILGIKPNNTLLFANNYWGCTMMFNKALKKLILPFPSEIHTHDHWITLNAFCFGQIIQIEETLIKYRRHGKNYSPFEYNPLPSLLVRIPKYFIGTFKKDYYQSEIIQLKAFYSKHEKTINFKLKKDIKSIVNLSNKINLWRKITFTIIYRLKKNRKRVLQTIYHHD